MVIINVIYPERGCYNDMLKPKFNYCACSVVQPRWLLLLMAEKHEENVELKKKSLSLSLEQEKTLVISEAHQKRR